MNRRAQAGLEYLLSYGWALVLIATVIGVLIFVVSSPNQVIVFNSSEADKVLVKGGVVSGEPPKIELRLQNITGGTAKVHGFSFTGNMNNISTTARLNNILLTEIDLASPESIIAGGELHFTGIDYDAGAGNIGTITISYKDYANLDRSVVIEGKRGT